VQPPLGREREASLLGDGDEITKMPELHSLPHACEIWLLAYKVFVGSARTLYFSVDRSDLERRPCGLAISGRTDGMSTPLL